MTAFKKHTFINAALPRKFHPQPDTLDQLKSLPLHVLSVNLPKILSLSNLSTA